MPLLCRVLRQSIRSVCHLTNLPEKIKPKFPPASPYLPDIASFLQPLRLQPLPRLLNGQRTAKKLPPRTPKLRRN